ncbi:unnamed protein product [Ranitomeya imitator]|uniref:tRNA-dihydrouridine synthase n=1 Tax=Ranitomeya imitator TaxID=111125 RepID=A0ABN9LSB5_9NEOB|nr:unnamed protein product [Ranitomeya imitator]
MLVVKYKDMRDILILTTMHRDNSSLVTVRGATTQVPKPDCILDYNKYTRGVDLSNQVLNPYSAMQKAKVWYKRLAVHIVHMALLFRFAGNTGTFLQFQEVVVFGTQEVHDMLKPTVSFKSTTRPAKNKPSHSHIDVKIKKLWLWEGEERKSPGWAMAEGYGACLINQPQLVSDMVKQVRSQVENKRFSISIKIRIHADIARTVDLCRKAEAAGVSWITVHGRLCEERHQPVHYDAIKIIKDSLSIPVVANGDIKSLKEAESIHQKTGADGVMAARGLLANPAMFAGYEETPMACIQDWIDIALEHGTPFTCFHHHLMYMMEKITSKQEKRVFNVLSSTSAVLDYLRDSYGV